MKTLYLSDLDGTLLNNNASISEVSRNILNDLISKGLNFTAATARTYTTVIPMLKDITLNVPLVLMNGVCIFDPKEKKPVVFHQVNVETGKSVIDEFLNRGKYPLVYFNRDDKIVIEYQKLSTKSQEEYVYQRKTYYNKRFCAVKDYSLTKEDKLVYIVTLDKKNEIEEIYNAVKMRDDVFCNFYPDNYYEGEYFLEIFKKDVSKASGALLVKELIGADKIVAFGDNLNDLPIFQIADESYAVSNACEELKAAATGVIASNNEDAVAKFLLDRYNNGLL